MKRRVLTLLILLLLLTLIMASAAAARNEPLSSTNGNFIYLPLILQPYVCSGEGELISLLDPTQVCCPGLDTIDNSFPGVGGGCDVILDSAICAYCGDGTCGLGENYCNCPADC